MGVIRRQSLKHSIVNFTGLIIGAFSTLFVYPHALEAYGLAQVLLSVGMIGLPLLSLGANTVAIRFFPRFENKASGHHGFLPLLLMMCAAGILLFVGVASLFWGPLSESLAAKARGGSALLSQYLWLSVPLAALYVTVSVMGQYSFNFKRIVVPSLLIDFFPKVGLPLLLIAVWQEWLSLEAALGGLLLLWVFITGGMVFYLRRLGEWYIQPDWSFLSPVLRKELWQFVGFGALGGFAMQMASKIDVFMVGSVGTLNAAGIYSIAAYIAAAIDIPTKSLFSASVSSVAKYVAEGNRPELEGLYKKVCINLLVAGLLLFGAVWISVDSLFQIVPNGEEVAAGKYVLCLIGLSRIVDMSAGLNNYIVYYSRYYLWSLLSLGVLAVANVALNLWLIPRIGMNGAAIATLVSVVCYNVVNMVLIWLKFRLFPYTRQAVLAAGMALGAFGLAQLIPHTGFPLLDIALRSGAYVLLLGALVLRLRVSPDLNEGLRVLKNNIASRLERR
ncbi:MAG: polysaccharide biosynthesis C-terminal domain-containing protein [Saprospiraceae bacterium]|nr:polysaccharide biosynthesis C-terminal domain-containing protein [Saprospiraceae bacterium]